MADKNYIDPVTGEPCTKAEYDTKCAAAGITPTTTPTSPSTVYPAQDISGLYAGLSSEGGLTTSSPYSAATVQQMMDAGTFPSGGILWGQVGAPTIEQLLAGQYPQVGGQPTPAPVTMPTFGAGAAAGIPTPEIKPAPPYKPSPELQAWQEEYAPILTDWVKSGGYGIPEETQALMIQQQTDTLNAREQENIRVMRNNMERRGITNSGYIDANMHIITSNTTVALAGAIADVQIKSALMKMASFEKAMGAASQFLGYLSEQSQLAYAPEFATWSAEQLATMQAWQGQLDIYKMELNQAYQTQNIREQARLQGILAEQQHGYDIELAEMEIAFQQEAAKAEGAGQLMGSASGLVGFLIAGS